MCICLSLCLSVCMSVCGCVCMCVCTCMHVVFVCIHTRVTQVLIITCMCSFLMPEVYECITYITAITTVGDVLFLTNS